MPRGIANSGKRAPWGSKTRSNIAARITGVEMQNANIEIETDEQIHAKLNERFEVLNELVQGSIDGDVRAIIVSGPAGLGKSYSVEKLLEANSVDRKSTRLNSSH